MGEGPKSGHTKRGVEAAKLGVRVNGKGRVASTDDDAALQQAYNLSLVGGCLRRAGQMKDAEHRFRRALNIYESKLGPSDMRVGCMLHELGLCVSNAGRKEHAANLLTRALIIKEATLGPWDLQVCLARQRREGQKRGVKYSRLPYKMVA